jgi:LysM repeat protein
MSNVRQAFTGILAAVISAVIILGSIVLALTETGQKIARLPEGSPELSTPMPPVATSKPGQPTYTAVPTRVLPTPTATDTFRCTPPPGWGWIEALPGDTWESLAEQSSRSLDELLTANCLEPEDIKNSKLGYGMLIALPASTPTPAFTLTQTDTTTATPTRTPEPTKAKSGQSKPKATTCAGHPAGWVIYTVQPGDTLYKIGLQTGVGWVVLRNANCLTSSLIRTGTRLWVPRLPVFTPMRTSTPRPTRTATLTRTSPPTTAPPDTAVPTDTERPTEPPPPSDTPVPSDTPAPPPYP